MGGTKIDKTIDMADKTFPSSTLFHYPILLTLADGNMHTTNELIAIEIEKLSISESNQQVVTPGKNGKAGRNKVESWTRYAIADLMKAEYIVHSSDGYVITDSGKQFLDEHREGFVANDLKASEAYRKYKRMGEFKKPKDAEPAPLMAAEPISEPEPDEPTEDVPAKSPIEILEELSTHINETLENTLLDALKKMSPDSFERLIKELLIKMEICKSEECIELTPYVKDDGVDLYVYDNILKMNVVCCIQVKKYTENAIGLSTVKELGGTLLDKNCKSGMVITTTQFTKGASDYNPSGYNIQKIDGNQLTKLLVSYGLGIKTKRVVVNTVDTDYLNSL